MAAKTYEQFIKEWQSTHSAMDDCDCSTYGQAIWEAATKAAVEKFTSHNSASSQCPLCECETVSRIVTVCSNIHCQYIEASRALPA